MKRWMTVAAMAAVLTAVTLQAEEQKAEHPQRQRAQAGAPRAESLLPPRLMGDLALTDEQKTKYDAINAEWQKERDTWVNAHKDERQKLHAEMEEARKTEDKEKMKQLGQQLRAQSEPFVQMRKKYMDQVEALLTPDQKKKVEEGREAMRQRMGERRGERQGKQGPPPKRED